MLLSGRVAFIGDMLTGGRHAGATSAPTFRSSQDLGGRKLTLLVKEQTPENFGFVQHPLQPRFDWTGW